jgi:hypothetical protein
MANGKFILVLDPEPLRLRTLGLVLNVSNRNASVERRLGVSFSEDIFEENQLQV